MPVAGYRHEVHFKRNAYFLNQVSHEDKRALENTNNEWIAPLEITGENLA